MTDVDAERPTTDVVEPPSSGDGAASSGSRRRRVRRSRATAWFGVTTLVFIAVLGAMLWEGWETAKEVKGANRLEQETDPAAPGFQAEVRPTPTQLVGQLDAEGGLADMVLLAEGTEGAGGAAVFIPGATVVDREGELLRLSEIYEAQGWPSVVDSVGRFLGAGFTETAVVTTTQAEALLSTVGPITVENPDSVVVDREGVRVTAFEAGTLTLDPAQAAEFMTVVGVGESPLNRSFRQQLVWEALLERLSELGEAAEPQVDASEAGETSIDLAGILTEMAQGPVVTQPIPLLRVPVGGPNGFAADVPEPEAIAELVPRIIPFPSSSFPGQRSRVRVLNATQAQELELLVAAAAVRSGAQVVIVGNADSFGATETTVEYHDPARAAEAERIAEALGGKAVVQSPAQTDAFDVTITVGSDMAGAGA